jgi:hypothetical protein
MRRVKLLISCCLAAGALSSFALAAWADTPPPEPESPGCGGHAIATRNHNSGSFGASGNPKSSAGPGFFLSSHQETRPLPRATSEGVHAAKEECL